MSVSNGERNAEKLKARFKARGQDVPQGFQRYAQERFMQSPLLRSVQQHRHDRRLHVPLVPSDFGYGASDERHRSPHLWPLRASISVVAARLLDG